MLLEGAPARCQRYERVNGASEIEEGFLATKITPACGRQARKDRVGFGI